MPQALVLAADAAFMPERQLRSHIRKAADCGDGDWLLSRRRGRAASIVVSAELADLLREFSSPLSIEDGVASYCARHRLNSASVMAGAHDALLRMQALGYLVSTYAKSGVLEPFGATAPPSGAWSKPQLIQNLDGTQIYRVEWQERACALKVGRPRSITSRPDSIVRQEAQILARLPPGPFAELLDAGAVDGQDYLLCTWFEGDDVLTFSNRRRSRDIEGVLELCARILESYSALETAGWLHGDVHPRNIIVTSDGTPRLIDFGQSRGLDQPRRGMRAGIAYFFDPQYAAALLDRIEAGAYDTASEQYALAALLQMLITGHHYQDFRLERRHMLSQIVNGERSPLPSHKGPDAPALETVLSKALSKSPACRFAKINEFSTAFRGALSVPRKPASGAGRPTFIPGGIRTLAWDASEHQISQLSEAAVHDGAAGFAYAQYRAALLTGNASLLASSEVWIARALNFVRRISDPSHLGPFEPFPASLHHGVIGIHCVAALIAVAQGNWRSASEAASTYIRLLPATDRDLDLTHGLAGALIGCALLAEAFAGAENQETAAALREAGDRIAISIWPTADRQVSKAARPGGIAHGEIGRLFANARWMQASRTPLQPGVIERLEALFSDNPEIGNGSAATMKNPAPYVRASWCNGAAGHVQLLSLLGDLTGSDGPRRQALIFAETAWRDEAKSACLCCGRAGRAFALLSASRIGGESIWVQRAVELVDAAEAALPLNVPGLYKGSVGVELARIELAAPHFARMPLFE